MCLHSLKEVSILFYKLDNVIRKSIAQMSMVILVRDMLVK